MIEEFLRAAAGLKSVPRQGWIDKAGIGRPESVADHSFAVAAAAMAVGDAFGMDSARMVKMALLHDLAESATGDVTPDAMDRGEKAALEDAAMRRVLGTLPEPPRAAYLRLWEEYSAGRSAEASAVRQLDKLEMGAQAAAYSRRYPGADFAPFEESARRGIADPRLARILDGLRALEEREPAGGGDPDPAAVVAGREPAGGGDLVQAQKQVIAILFEVVRRLQRNNDLDEEYLQMAASGGAAANEGRLDEILAQRKENAAAAAGLLSRLEQ